MKQIYLMFIEIDSRAIINFLLGFVTGFVLLFLIWVLLITLSQKKRFKKRMLNKLPLENHEVLELIDIKQNQLVDTVRLTDNAYFSVALDLSIELVEEIARHYFPNSKYPIYELSIEELLELNRYITYRIDGLVNTRIIKLFKGYRVSKIVSALKMKKAITNSKAMKLSRKLNVSKFYSASRTVLNYANPMYWFRKTTVKPMSEVVVKMVCKQIIALVGEETNKVYSKSFSEEKSDDNLETNLDQLLEEEES